jgi:MFS transporter, ACS family, hexuronate transporter
VMGIVLVAYLVICWAFMQIFLTKMRGYTDTEASWLMATLGISATIGSFAIAGLSDVIGRKPVMIVTSLLGVILPLGALYYDGPAIGMAAIFFIGWSMNGIFPLFMATVPSESVPPAMGATVFGLCMGSCEILGGAGGPPIAGMLADNYGLSAPLWMMVGLALVGGLTALGLRETAPRVLARRMDSGFTA